MLEQNVNEYLVHKANLYKILSALYCIPDEELDAFLQHLPICLANIMPELELLGQQMAEDFQSLSDLGPVKVDHAKLFVGPFDLLAPPYSSIYLDNQRTIMGDSTIEAYEYYLDAGLDVGENFKQPPDHISVELEFMYYLLANYIKTNDQVYLEKYGQFLKRHLGLWISPFAEKIAERAETDFYRNLGVITRRLIETEVSL